MKVCVLENPGARRPGAPDWDGLLKDGLGEDPWWKVEYRPGAEGMRDAVGEAVAREAEHIVLVGGDGTLGLAAGALLAMGYTERVTLGLLPGGTCNDFARFQGVSRRDAEGAVWNALRGPVRPVDLGLANGRVFVNHAGAGREEETYRKLAARKAWLVRHGAPRLLVSLAHSLETALRLHPIPISARVDGRSVGGTAFLVMALNGPYFSGGIAFTRDIAVDDHRLEFCFVRPTGKARLLAWLASASTGLMRRVTPPPFVEIIRGRRLELETGETVWPQSDGEPPEPGGCRRVVFELAPVQLHMRLPGRRGARERRS